MPKARTELLSAASSYAHSGENRLTEILATVLATKEALARAICSAAGLPSGDRYEVSTQERVAPGCIPDLVVRIRRDDGALIGQLWAEHKTVSGFRFDQREDYTRALALEPGVGKLMTITVEPTDDSEGTWKSLTWQQVAEIVDEVGRTAGGSRWRRTALEPTAPAQDRLLHELLWYLENEGFAVVRPLSLNNVQVFAAMADTVEALAALIREAADQAEGYVDDSIDAGDDAFWFHVAAPEGAWLDDLDPFERYCEVLLCATDEWSPRGIGQPAVAAGYTIDRRLHKTLSSNEAWVHEVTSAGFTLEPWAGYLRCWRTRHLADFVAERESLKEQAQALAAFGLDSIRALNQLRPEGLVLPEVHRGGRG